LPAARRGRVRDRLNDPAHVGHTHECSCAKALVRHSSSRHDGGVRGSEDNQLQGDFGEAWIGTIAAGSGLTHGRTATLDLIKSDVQISFRGEWAGSLHPTVGVQVKTTIEPLRSVEDDSAFSYDLEAETYDLLRRGNHVIPRVLAVIELPKGGERFRLTDEGTLLHGHGVWVSLEGLPERSNRSTVVVRLPKANRLDPEGLHRMVKTHGVRRSPSVPDIDPWVAS
jgi:hypothetical protein